SLFPSFVSFMVSSVFSSSSSSFSSFSSFSFLSPSSYLITHTQPYYKHTHTLPLTYCIWHPRHTQKQRAEPMHSLLSWHSARPQAYLRVCVCVCVCVLCRLHICTC